MKKKNYLYNSFIKSKNNIGSFKNKTNSKYFSYLNYLKNNKYYLNTYISINQFKRLTYFFNKTLQNNKKILIIFNEYEYPFLKNKLKNFNQFIFTNNKNINKYFKKYDNINIIINLGVNENKELLNIFYYYKKPIISFLNTEKFFNKRTYNLIGNNKNIKSNFFIIYLFLKILKK